MLTFAKDSNVTSIVVADGRVEFEGQTLSPSASALLAVKRMGSTATGLGAVFNERKVDPFGFDSDDDEKW